MSNFSFSRSVFKRLQLQTRKKQDLFGKELTIYLTQKHWDLSKSKAFADDNITAAQMMRFFFDMIENIVEKGENAGYQHFLLFLQCFQMTYSFWVFCRHCVEMG